MLLEALKEKFRKIDAAIVRIWPPNPIVMPDEAIIYLLLQQLEQHERHMAEVRERYKADEAWKEEIRKREERIFALQEKHTRIERERLENERQHTQAMREQHERLVQRIIEEIHKNPEFLNRIMMGHESSEPQAE